jgi:hypothetical protein
MLKKKDLVCLREKKSPGKATASKKIVKGKSEVKTSKLKQLFKVIRGKKPISVKK